MKRFLLLPVFVSLASSLPVSANTSDAPRLIWSDEFDQPEGAPPLSSHWVHDLGASGWGNKELQNYTDAAANASIVADSHTTDGKALAIRALKTAPGVYTSARLKTLGRFAPKYGRIEARVKLPGGQGIWPAFWMLGTDIGIVGWPACGEIDIVESINAHPKTVYGTLHGPGYSGDSARKGRFTLRSGTLDEAYHVYAVDWSPDKIVWSFDGTDYHTETAASIPAGSRWVFNDHPFFLILNLAVGGHWPGYPDSSTTFPQTCLIDYVRVYESTSSTPKESGVPSAPESPN
jgi:beta-glucanase (GH16 family)